MKTRTRRPTDDVAESNYFDLDESLDFDIESLDEEELAEFLFDQPEASPRGIFNLPTVAGLSLIMVGVAYIFQQLGLWGGLDISKLALMLPWIAGMLIILLGFGVLSWRPNRKKKRVKKAIEVPSGKKKVVVEARTEENDKSSRRRLTKARDKKIAGVCGGIAEYFNVDPTLVRIAFVIATVASNGGFLLAYLALSMAMPAPKPLKLEDRITIVRDS